MRRKLLVFAGVVLVLLALWRTASTHRESQAESWTPDSIYIFHDRQDAVLEHLYAMRDQEAVVQVAVFPGYGERKWYYCEMFPVDLFQRVKSWAVRGGDISPPFKPHGPWFSRLTFTPDKTRGRGEAWFRDDNLEVQEWFQALRHGLVRDKYRVDTLPPWVEDDERVNWPSRKQVLDVLGVA